MTLFIDEARTANYYSAMNLKAIYISLFCLIVSACQHSNKPLAEQPSLSEQPLASNHDALNNDNITNDAIPTSTAITSDNVLERMRNGFRFPDFESKHVDDYEKWNASHATYLNSLFERGEPFLFHIVEEIEKRGLPMELALLPAIESAYRPTAVSRSKAAGLWQFIPSTGKSFGLTQDWWYDGRLDVLLSTNAALDYLTLLNKRFKGDWFLTLAAYNAGQGTVSRAMRQNKRKGKKPIYTELSLRSETRRYVPKLIALKNIINNPSAFGVTLPVVRNASQFDVITTSGQIDLEDFSRDTNIDRSALKNLNAGFLRRTTPPSGPHRILIPSANSQTMTAVLLAVKNTVKTDYQQHKIARGDTLSGIARRYGINVKAIKTANNLKNNSIRAGRNLLIPLPTSTALQTAGADTASSPNPQKVVHQVKKGDTLWAIARHYKVRVSELLAWNQLSKQQTLRLDQSLVLFTN